MADEYLLDDLAPAAPTRAGRRDAQSYSAAIATGSAANDYVTPGDPPIPVVGPEVDPDWPDRPVWVDRYLRDSIETDYPPYPPSFAQRRECAALGIICPPTWVEARAWIARTRKKQRASERATAPRESVATQRKRRAR